MVSSGTGRHQWELKALVLLKDKHETLEKKILVCFGWRDKLSVVGGCSSA